VIVALLALLFGALVYSLLSIIAAFRYVGVLPPALSWRESISILKPLAGLDDGLEANLQTFFAQDYPSFEIVFAVREDSDPAVGVVEKLRREYPHVPTRLVVTGESPYPNAKVFSLDLMLSVAANDLVVMSDSDIRVTPDLLRTVAAEFQDARVGIATCPYRSVPGESIWPPYVVENHIGSLGLRHNAAHRLRWVRSTRRSRPAGYLGQLFTMPVPLALIVCLADPTRWQVLPLTLFVRGVAAYVVSARVLHTRIDWLLLPVEDLIGFCFWLAGFSGNIIVWRGRRYRLYPDGRFELLHTEADA